MNFWLVRCSLTVEFTIAVPSCLASHLHVETKGRTLCPENAH